VLSDYRLQLELQNWMANGTVMTQEVLLDR